ncbi:flavodoxin [Sedimentibacter sp. B4]|uniref:flavodoxin family protein n=1 Tax=Sedimentibacter sp. B4 TaxID=304766 RepID=UPI0002E7DA03|nr:flavodoxin [Sedimentibacter sp. B4]
MKNLVVYYTLSGNTEAVAKEISNLSGGELKKIELVKEPEAAGFAWAAFSSILGLKGKIKSTDLNDDGYDNIFIGGQVWAGHSSTPLNSILHSMNFKNKNVYIFLTLADEKEPTSVIKSMTERIERKGGNFADVFYVQSKMKEVLKQEELNQPLKEWLSKNNVLQSI